jgi:ribosomal-protein-alanine N-acetyltransferase
MMPPLRPVSAAHAPLLAGMHRICFSEFWDAAALLSLLVLPGTCGFLAAETDSLPQGFVLARAAAGEGEILTLLVLPPFRRQGLASRLLNAAADAVRRDGGADLFLEVAADNSAGQALYAAHGFRQVGRRPRYYGGRTDALVLCKTLTDPSG